MKIIYWDTSARFNFYHQQVARCMVFAKRLFDLFGGCYSLVLPEQPQTENGKFTICEINFTFLHLWVRSLVRMCSTMNVDFSWRHPPPEPIFRWSSRFWAQICQVETGVVHWAIIGWNFYSQLKQIWQGIQEWPWILTGILLCETNMKHMMF